MAIFTLIVNPLGASTLMVPIFASISGVQLSSKVRLACFSSEQYIANINTKEIVISCTSPLKSFTL